MPNKPACKPSGAAIVSPASERRTHLSPNTAPRNGPAPPTQHRRKAVETLAETLTNAGEKAREAIQQRVYLDWHTYVEALQQEFEQELRRLT
jgi:hypothetical protein